MILAAFDAPVRVTHSFALRSSDHFLPVQYWPESFLMAYALMDWIGLPGNRTPAGGLPHGGEWRPVAGLSGGGFSIAGLASSAEIDQPLGQFGSSA